LGVRAMKMKLLNKKDIPILAIMPDQLKEPLTLDYFFY